MYPIGNIIPKPLPLEFMSANAMVCAWLWHLVGPSHNSFVVIRRPMKFYLGSVFYRKTKFFYKKHCLKEYNWLAKKAVGLLRQPH
jgi:hypothetical protein